MHCSIRVRLTVAFLGLAIGPLLLVGAVLVWRSYTQQQQQALLLHRQVKQRVATQVTAFFAARENELRVVSKVQGLPRLDQEKQHSILSELLLPQHIFEELVSLDGQGHERTRVSRSILSLPQQRDYSTAEAFVIPQTSGQAYYSPVRFEEMRGEPLLTIAVPSVDARTGQVDGVLISEVRLKTIWNLIADLHLSPGQSVYIVDTRGRVVAHRKPSIVLRGTYFAVPAADGTQPGLSGTRVVLATHTVRFGG